MENQESSEKVVPHNKLYVTKENKGISFFPTKKRKIFVIMSLGAILLVILISFVFFYFFYILKKDKDKDKENNSKNIIKATYQITSGEKIKLFNYKNIKNEDYTVTLLDNNKKLRNLEGIISSEFMPDFNGYISVNIEFKKSLNTLECLFENITQLKKIDLTNFDMSDVTNIDSMFSGCTSLEDIILSGVDTRNLKSMNYLFKNCKNLKEVDMSSINSQKLDNMSSPFSGCENILSINLSSFVNVEDDILNGINTKVNIISNERIYNKLNKISLNSLNINIKIDIILNINSKFCEIGENEKCKTCSSLLQGNCLLCSKGYYLPIDLSNKKIYSSCKKEHCKKCFGTSFLNLCQECEDGWIYFRKRNM